PRCLPQPRPTLLPYTTLFRSKGQREFVAGRGQLIICLVIAALGVSCLKTFHMGQSAVVLQLNCFKRHGKICLLSRFYCLIGTPGDRKSTRLNSSHLVISYDVF